MELDHLLIETEPPPDDVQFLDHQINAFNIAQTGIHDDRLLACFVRDEARRVVAGIYGWTWGGCCEIRSLWVQRELRGLGYGRRLLLAAEKEAMARGCTQVVLDTHSFQAPRFYQKLGYEIIGIVQDYPLHEQKLYLRKRLR
jgi:ribosomal protein S18 acetylase RimI-like enzyme